MIIVISLSRTCWNIHDNSQKEGPDNFINGDHLCIILYLFLIRPTALILKQIFFWSLLVIARLESLISIKTKERFIWPPLWKRSIGYNRAVFNWVSKVISESLWFMITSLSYWFKVLAPFFQPIRSEIKTNRGSRMHISQASCRLHAITSSFDCLRRFWLAKVITLVLVLRHSIENQSNPFDHHEVS